MSWKPVHAAHSIEQAVVLITFSEPITDRAWSRVISAATSSTKREGLTNVADNFEFGIQLSASGQPGGAGGVSFNPVTGGKTFSSEDKLGVVDEQLELTKAKLVFRVNTYSRWKSFRDRFEAIVGPIYPIIEAVVSPSQIHLEYLDRFVFDGDINSANAAMDTVLNRGSPYITETAFVSTDLWHTYVGQFVPQTDKRVQLLVNVNTDLQDGHQMAASKRSLSVRTSAADRFNQPNYQVMPPDELTFENVSSRLQKLHEDLKVVLSEHITEGMAKRISLGGRSS